jgi:hypothetical protein
MSAVYPKEKEMSIAERRSLRVVAKMKAGHASWQAARGVGGFLKYAA